MIDTFSANSLKILDSSLKEFKMRYLSNLYLIEDNEELKVGNKFHNIICYYLKNFDIEKFKKGFNSAELQILEQFINSEIVKFAISGDEKFIEQPFFVKINDKYLTGRFDAVIKKNETYYILDWKINNLPKNPNSDIQTLVYIYSLSKLYKTKNIKMVYYSILKNEKFEINIDENKLNEAKEKIVQIINKLT